MIICHIRNNRILQRAAIKKAPSEVEPQLDPFSYLANQTGKHREPSPASCIPLKPIVRN